MKVLITGSRGMLGRDLVETLTHDCELVLHDEETLDIRDSRKVHDTITAALPAAVINCAAYTNVDGCEAHADLAYAVNADGAGNLAAACRVAGAALYHISTDFVFDGRKQSPYTENDPPAPLSVYGASKLAGERQVLEALPDGVILRTSWLFGRHGKNFVETVIRLSETQPELRIVNDQTGCPTLTVDLAVAIKKLLATGARGIYHVANSGACTWHAFAERILKLKNSPSAIMPITTRELNRPAARPAYSVLDCSRFTALTGMKMRPWEDALGFYMCIR